MLFGSGLVGGGGLTGVLLAIWVFASGKRIQGIPLDLTGLSPVMQTVVAQGLALSAVAAILLIMRYLATRSESG